MKQVEDLQSELTEAYPQSEFRIVHADFNSTDGAEKLAQQVRHVGAVIVANGQSMYKLLQRPLPRIWMHYGKSICKIQRGSSDLFRPNSASLKSPTSC